MRRILHLFALLALILVGSVPELRMEAATAPTSSCCGAAGCGCGMPAKGPSSSTCQTQVTVTLPAAPQAKAQEQVGQAEVRKEPAPWPRSVVALRRHNRIEVACLPGINMAAPSPPDRLALLSSFRI